MNFKRRNTIVAVAVALLVVLWSTSAAAQTNFTFSPGGVSQALFNSDAPLESITGTSNSVAGQVSIDLANPAGATGSVSIPVASLQTGIEMRDSHLHSADWLDAEAHPDIVFELTSISGGGALETTVGQNFDVSGNLTIHGVTMAVTAPAEVTYYEIPEDQRNPMGGITGNALRIEAEFGISLSDYGVNIPPFLELKVSNDINLTLRLTGMDS